MRGLLRTIAVGLLAVAGWTASAVPVLAAGAQVPVLGQRWTQWAHDRLGTDPTDTIGTAGCVVTSVAMVQSAFGRPTDPQALNRWLTAHGGYVEDDLILWRQAAVATGGAVRWKWPHVRGIVPQLRTDDQNIDDLPTAAMVRDELDAGNLVVAEVRLLGHFHFVVLTGHVGDNFTINDPWYADRTTLRARYGDYAQAVKSAWTYYRTT